MRIVNLIVRGSRPELSNLRRLNRHARIQTGRRPETITAERLTAQGKRQRLHPTKGWRCSH